MAQYGILVDYEWCTGCHSCEVACKKELGLGEGEFGIKLTETGPWKYETGQAAGAWEWTWTPVITKACNLCEERVAKGKMPMCVQHCQAKCLEYGPLEELNAKLAAKTKQAVFALGE